MSECEKCHGKGTIPCSTCKGKKTEPCKECNGVGSVTCDGCDGKGEVTCEECYGSGKEVCPVCYKGEVEKTRWINCSNCGGDGRDHGDGSRCWRCHGRGQVEETYYEICPNCHGDYSHYSDKTCSECNGTGKVKCDECGGGGAKDCETCDGTGQVTCSHCKGEGKERCPDCEKREREAKEKREREAREAKERRERKEREERNRRIAEREKMEAEEKAAKERKEAIQGCGCLLALVAIVGFFIWWWFEGMTMSALPGMWEQTKNCVGGSGGIVKIVGGLIALFLGWKLITAFKHKAKKSSEVSMSPKKRWKFVVLGILLGFFGVHLAYAKRWLLFLLLWAGFIVGNVMSDGASKAEQDTANVPQVTQTENQGKKGGSPIGGIGFAVWALLWIGGTLFIKKDGKGNRM